MYIENDGGRKAAGFKAKSNDCAIRSLSIAANIEYKEAMMLIKEFSAKGKKGNKAIANGVYREDFDAALRSIGWQWHQAPKFEGRKARYSDIDGIAILRMAKHFAAVVNGELHDTWDSSGKMVYGYWKKIKKG